MSASASLKCVDVSSVDPVFFGERNRAFLALTYLFHLFVRQFAVPVVSSVMMAALDRRIFIIVALRSYTKMPRVHAGRIITSVHDDLSRWNLANEMFVGIPMGAYLNLTRQQKDAVPISIFGTSPYPARVRLFYAALKCVKLINDRPIPKISVLPFVDIARATKAATDSLTLIAQQTLLRLSSNIAHYCLPERRSVLYSMEHVNVIL